ncbi:MAG: toll/interleukin-1 receptor domain-containing protein [Pseudomonadota bacterium]|nr:toll/interleukin-1 receptor domain-containing protein [Pseudomonadota bacterium]
MPSVPAGDFKHNVFLSHNSKDKPAVRELKRLL